MEWTEAKNLLVGIQQRHFSESGKIIQKILALSLQRLGYDHLEERSIQGVDIDVMNQATGEKHAFEVKTSITTEIVIGAKDTKGLRAREEDGYQTFYAVLCQPLFFSKGWIIVPAAAVKEGKHGAMRLWRKRNAELCERVNSVFPELVGDVGPSVLTCPQGKALALLREKYGI
jgi:hypothetical protein